MITPKDHMSHDLSYFSGPSTSGAEWANRYNTIMWAESHKNVNHMQTHMETVINKIKQILTLILTNTQCT